MLRLTRLVRACTYAIALTVLLWLLPAVQAPTEPRASHVYPASGYPASGEASAAEGRRPSRIPPLDASNTVLAFPPPPIQARAAVLEDLNTGKVLYAKNADERLPMASTTKITTAVLALNYSKLDDMVPVSQRAATIGESTMGLQRGERLTVRQLLYGLMLNSGNDAAVALAEHVGGSVQRFVRMMNELAASLRMRNTHYMTPHGLDAPGHFSSARDLATIARYAMRDSRFRRIVGTLGYHIRKNHLHHEHWLASVNRVMYWYPGVNGVKPGDTDNAGLCQVVSVRRDGRQLLAVLLNTPTLVFDIRNLLNYGLRDFRWVQAPAYWDGPADGLTGGEGSRRWLYLYGAGHYIRGAFLRYFSTHGGLPTFGYPRTEAITFNHARVQFFQNALLIYDPARRTAFPAELARGDTPRRGRVRPDRVSEMFKRKYRLLGGRKVLGPPVGGLVHRLGYPAQPFRYGELALVGGVPELVPLGDRYLVRHGLLPARGAGDAFPPGTARQLE